MVQNHCSAADYAGLIAVGGWQYLEFAGSECGRVAVDGLAQTGHEYVVGLRDVASDRPGPVTDRGQTATYWKILATLFPCSSEPMRQRPAV